MFSAHALPLTCKLTVIKTFILSQFSYIGATLPASNEIIENIEHIIMKFLFPGANTFPKSRVFCAIKVGGLGLPPIRDYLDALIAKTSLRAHSSNQPWAISIRNVFHNNKVYLKNKSSHPIEMAQSYVNMLIQLSTKFFNHPKRFWSAPIFLSNTFLDNAGSPVYPHILNFNCRVKDVICNANKRILSLPNMNAKLRTNLPVNTYFRLYGNLRRNLKFAIPTIGKDN